MTAPRQTTASLPRASCCATTGSSSAPVTRTTMGSATPHSFAAARARSSSRSVTWPCQRAQAMPSVSPEPSTAAASGRPVPLMTAPRLRGPRGALLFARCAHALQLSDPVAEAVPLGREVAPVVLGDDDGQGYPPAHLDPERFQPLDLGRIVGQQPN